MLPSELWCEILLYLDSQDVASFVLCYAELYSEIVRPYFLKRYWQRFSRISCNRTLNYLRAERALAKFNPISMWSVWCNDRVFLPSGHCVACLTHPHLLCFSPFQSGCHCLDHRLLWYGLNRAIIWKAGSFQDLGPGWSWPECGVTVLSPKKRKRLYKKVLSTVKRDQILGADFL